MRWNPKLFLQVLHRLGLGDGDPDIVANDGKASPRTHARSKARQPPHMVSAWASRQWLELKGAIVTIDAIGCQPKIAATILEWWCRPPRATR
jgi:hypothetical protein